MDRRRRRALLIAAAGGACLAAAAPPLKEMRWLAPGQDRAVLAERPGECLRPTADEAERASIEIGRAAFRTPLLLGGEAARSGLSCNGCHQDGRGNALFRFPGVSGDPGTADVTSSLFSRRRGDAVHDPKPIPDLGGPRTALKIAPADLQPFIRGLVVEEFDGPEPSARVLAGLAAYVRSLDPAVCETGQARRPRDDLDDAHRAVEAGLLALGEGDDATALLMVASARSALGRLHERFDRPGRMRPALEAADRALANIAGAIRAKTPDAERRLAAWRRRLTELSRLAQREAGGSLYDRSRLAAAPPLPPGGS